MSCPLLSAWQAPRLLSVPVTITATFPHAGSSGCFHNSSQVQAASLPAVVAQLLLQGHQLGLLSGLSFSPRGPFWTFLSCRCFLVC